MFFHAVTCKLLLNAWKHLWHVFFILGVYSDDLFDDLKPCCHWSCMDARFSSAVESNNMKSMDKLQRELSLRTV